MIPLRDESSNLPMIRPKNRSRKWFRKTNSESKENLGSSGDPYLETRYVRGFGRLTVTDSGIDVKHDGQDQIDILRGS